MSPRAKKQLQRAYARNAFRDHAKHRQPGDLHTIPSFCLSNAISESLYYSLKRRDLGPREMEVEGVIRITPQAEADWRVEREKATAEAKRKRKAAEVDARAAGEGLPR